MAQTKYKPMKELKKVMKEKGITQEKLGEYMGINQSNISRWINGETRPDIDQLRKLKTILNTTYDKLL